MKRLLALLFLLLHMPLAFGQGVPLPDVQQEQFGAAGTANALGYVCTYAAGTSTPLDTYSDSALTSANHNPLRLNAAGRPVTWNTSTEVEMFAQPYAYKVVIYATGTGNTCNGTTVGSVISTRDNISAFNILYRNFATITDDKVCHASQITGTTPNDESGKIAYCITTILPSGGGTVDTRGLEGAQEWSACPYTGVTKPVTLITGTGTRTLSINCTQGTSILWKPDSGSIISMNTGVTLTVNGSVEAGLYKIFAWSGTGTVNFVGGGSQKSVHEVPVEWFGAVGDGATDDYAAIQRAINSVDGAEGWVTLSIKQYCVGTGLSGASWKMKGQGYGSSLMTNRAPCTSINMGAVDFLTVTGGRQGLDFRDFAIYGTSTQNDGIDMTGEIGWRMYNITVNGFTRTGAACFKATSSYSGFFGDGTFGTCARGFELTRGSNGSGGVTIDSLHTSSMVERCGTIEASNVVVLENVECNSYGPGASVGVLITGTASVKQISVTINGGLYGAVQYPIQIGQAGTLAVEGVAINGALLSGCTSPDPCAEASGSTSAGVLIYSGINSNGITINGIKCQLIASCIRTTGFVDVASISIGSGSVSGLISPGYFFNINGTELLDVDGADLAPRSGFPASATNIAAAANSRPFTSAQCNQFFNTGATTYLCGYAAIRAHADTTAVGNVGGGTDTLQTWNIPAGFFDVGRILRLDFWGYTAANGNNKTITCYWGAQQLWTAGPTAANNQSWTMSAILTGGAANTAQIKVYDKSWNGAAIVTTTIAFAGNITDARDIYCTGVGTADNDIVASVLNVSLEQ